MSHMRHSVPFLKLRAQPPTLQTSAARPAQNPREAAVSTFPIKRKGLVPNSHPVVMCVKFNTRTRWHALHMLFRIGLSVTA